MFHVGQLVVCVTDGEWTTTRGKNPGEKDDFGPRKGEIVRIARVGYIYSDGLSLEGYLVDENGYLCAYHKRNFRPLVSRPNTHTESIRRLRDIAAAPEKETA